MTRTTSLARLFPFRRRRRKTKKKTSRILSFIRIVVYLLQKFTCAASSPRQHTYIVVVVYNKMFFLQSRDDSAKVRAASPRRRPPYPLVSTRTPSRRISPPSDSRPFCSCTRTRTRTQTRAPPWPTRRGIAPTPTWLFVASLTHKAPARRVVCSVSCTNDVVLCVVVDRLMIQFQ